MRTAVVTPQAQGQRVVRLAGFSDQEFDEATTVAVAARFGGDDQPAEVPGGWRFLPALGKAPGGTGGITQGEGVATFFGQQLFKVGGGKRVGQARPGPAQRSQASASGIQVATRRKSAGLAGRRQRAFAAGRGPQAAFMPRDESASAIECSNQFEQALVELGGGDSDFADLDQRVFLGGPGH